MKATLPGAIVHFIHSLSQGLITVTLCCLVLSSLSAPAPQPLIWPGLAAGGAGIFAFDLATGLVISGAGAATIPTSLLVAKAVAAKGVLIGAALAAQRAQQEDEMKMKMKPRRHH